MDREWEVMSPRGQLVGETVPLARRLDTLEGRTVCEIWNTGFRGDVSFPIMEKMLRERYPGVKVIPYTELPFSSAQSLTPSTKAQTLEAIRKALIEKGCDALITGNGC